MQYTSGSLSLKKFRTSLPYISRGQNRINFHMDFSHSSTLVGSNGVGTLWILSIWLFAYPFITLSIFVIIMKDHYPQDIRREALGGAWHGSRARKTSFSQHHSNIFWSSLLPWWRGSSLLSLYFSTFKIVTNSTFFYLLLLM